MCLFLAVDADTLALPVEENQTILSGKHSLFSLAFGDRSILVLLVFRHQIVHVALRFSELHLIHTFTSVPMQESLAPEHGSKLVTNTFEELLDRGRVANESRAHFEAARRDGAELEY